MADGQGKDISHSPQEAAGPGDARATAQANARKSAVRAHIEHVFAHRKHRMGLINRTIGLNRAEAKIGFPNFACNFQRLIFHERRAAMA